MSQQSRVYLSPPQTSQRDRELLFEAFDSNWIAPLGPHVDAFEREFAEKVEAPHAVALSSGTAALHLALIVSGIKHSDRVITPTLTFVATANAIRHAGAEPVFIDSDPVTWNLDPTLVDLTAHQLASTGRPASAVVSVDLFGQCADYDALHEVCDRHNLRLIADAAESLGATHRGRPAGSLADVSCFSFNGNKIITTSSGGMLTTNRRDWAERARHLASQARMPGVGYQHDEVGYNYRLSNLLAALGRGQLETLDERVTRCRAVFEEYHRSLRDLPGVTLAPEAPFGTATRWLSCLLVDPERAGCSRENLRLALEAENIESRPVWKPLHLQPAHASMVVKSLEGESVAERLWRCGLCLPSGASLSVEDQQRVIGVLRRELMGGRRAPAA